MTTRKGSIYILETNTGLYKIGRTNNLNRRLKTFEVRLPFEVSLLTAIEVDNTPYYESWLHHIFAEHRVDGEWFHLDYYSLKAIVEYLKDQQCLDEFIAWYEENKGEFSIKDEYKLTPGLLYCSEKDRDCWYFTDSTEHITIKQTEIDKAANEIWGVEPWDS